MVRGLVELMTMGAHTGLPRRAVMLIMAVVAGGLAAVAMRLPELSSWTTLDLGAMLGLVAATALGESFTIKVRYGTETKHISLTESAYAAALLLGVRPGVLTVGAALGVAVVHTARGTASHKVAFNVASYAVALTAAEAAYAGTHGGSPLGAAALAMAAFFVVNASTVVGVIAMATGRRFVEVFAPIGRVETTHAVGNLVLGASAVGLWMLAPAAVPAVAGLTAVAFAGYRALSPRRVAGTA